MLYTLRPTANAAELHSMLNDDLRIEDSELKKLDADLVAELSEHYHTTNVKRLSTLLRRLQK